MVSVGWLSKANISNSFLVSLKNAYIFAIFNLISIHGFILYPLYQRRHELV